MANLRHITTQWTKIENMRAQSGPKELGNYLAQKYFTPIIAEFKKRGASKIDAEELACEVFFILFKNNWFSRLKRKFPQDSKEKKGCLRGVFFKTMRFALLNSYRKKAKEFSPLPEEKNILLSESIGPENILEEKERDAMFAKCLQKLKEENPGLYEVLDLHQQKKKHQEIAEELKISVEASRFRLYRAKQWLRTRIEH